MKKRKFIKQIAASSLGAAVAPSVLLSACSQATNEGNETENATVANEVVSFSLPELGYEYNAFENTVDAMTMEIHYSKHHQGYVNKFNAALKEANVTSGDLVDILSGANISTGIRNSGGGHFNHSLFWESLVAGGSDPSETFLAKINQTFGSLDELKSAIIKGGGSVFGSGWVWLIQNNAGNMEITTTPNQDNPHMQVASVQGKPLLGIDVWEHAYYLKYQNVRGDYLKNIMEIINWGKVAERAGIA
ncbi:MAG: superoxide dismutase [Bacteroidota bacterium]